MGRVVRGEDSCNRENRDESVTGTDKVGSTTGSVPGSKNHLCEY